MFRHRSEPFRLIEDKVNDSGTVKDWLTHTINKHLTKDAEPEFDEIHFYVLIE